MSHIARQTVTAALCAALCSAAPLTTPSDLGGNVNSFGAYGNDNTDDTEAIRRALAEDRPVWSDFFGAPKMVYFPAGTYIVSDTLSWLGCAVTIQGQGPGATIIKLADGARGFGDPSDPRAVFVTPDGNMSFRQNFFDLTINTGSNNRGAIGLDYISSNSGAVRNVEIVSGDNNGFAGLAMTRQWPGPCLIKNVSIIGFDYGVRVACSEYGPTFENITLSGQKIAGIQNAGNVIAVRNLNSTNTVPALTNAGFAMILDSRLNGGTPANQSIVSSSTLYLRNVTATGYGSVFKQENSVYNGLSISEYCSDSVQTLFNSPKRSLGLPIAETPEFHEPSAQNWAGFSGGWYGDNNIGPVLNSGKSTVYLHGWTYLSDPARVVEVPATVRRIIGYNAVVNGGGYVFRVSQNSTEPLIIERFGYGVRIEHACARTVVIKHGKFGYQAQAGAGDVFFDDVESDELVFNPGQRVYMRQFNAEGPRLHITNNGARLWIMGIKTEGKGTVVRTTNGGFTEVLGTLLYPCETFTSSDGPAFVSVESSVSYMYQVSSYVTRGGYLTQVQETRGGVTRSITSDGEGYTMPLFAGFDSTAMSTGEPSVASHRADRPVSRMQPRVQINSSTARGNQADFLRYGLNGRRTSLGPDGAQQTHGLAAGLLIAPVETINR